MKNKRQVVLIWIGPTGGVGHFPPAAEAICFSIKYLFHFAILSIVTITFFSLLCSPPFHIVLFNKAQHRSYLLPFSFYIETIKERNLFFCSFFFKPDSFVWLERQWTINPSSHVSHFFFENFSLTQTNSFDRFEQRPILGWNSRRFRARALLFHNGCLLVWRNDEARATLLLFFYYPPHFSVCSVQISWN